MSRPHQTGIIIIVVGVLIPLIAYFFTVGNDIRSLTVVLRPAVKERYDALLYHAAREAWVLPYTLFLLVGGLFIILGVVKILRVKR